MSFNYNYRADLYEEGLSGGPDVTTQRLPWFAEVLQSDITGLWIQMNTKQLIKSVPGLAMKDYPRSSSVISVHEECSGPDEFRVLLDTMEQEGFALLCVSMDLSLSCTEGVLTVGRDRNTYILGTFTISGTSPGSPNLVRIQGRGRLLVCSSPHVVECSLDLPILPMFTVPAELLMSYQDLNITGTTPPGSITSWKLCAARAEMPLVQPTKPAYFRTLLNLRKVKGL